jgi:hypothetical protein
VRLTLSGMFLILPSGDWKEVALGGHATSLAGRKNV